MVTNNLYFTKIAGTSKKTKLIPTRCSLKVPKTTDIMINNVAETDDMAECRKDYLSRKIDVTKTYVNLSVRLIRFINFEWLLGQRSCHIRFYLSYQLY